MLILQLMFEFFKIGLFSVGGGQSTIPFLYDLVYRFDWFNAQELADMIAISESTPGPVGINMATYAGFSTAGFFGGVLATLALVCPCVIIIICISKILDAFRKNTFVENCFTMIRPSVVGLIASSAWTVFVISVLDVEAFQISGNFFDLFKIYELGLFVGLLILTFKWKKHPIVYLAIAMAIGIALGL